MTYDQFMHLVNAHLVRWGPAYRIGVVEMHWTQRDALIARLQRDYTIDGAYLVAHDSFEFQDVKVVENNDIPANRLLLRDRFGRPFQPLTQALPLDILFE